MYCTQCNSREATRGTLCHECVEANRQRIDRRSETVRLSVAVNKENTSWYQRLNRRWLEVALVVLMIGVLFGARLSPLRKTLPHTELMSVAGAVSDPCRAKERCFVAVVAPWCPACHATIGFLRVMRSYASRRENLGVQVVVSQDDMPKLQSMANEIGGPVYLDPNQRMRGSAVPRWWAIDDQRKIVVRGSGLPFVSEEGPDFNSFLHQKLKL